MHQYNQKILGQFTSEDYKKTSIIQPPSADLYQESDMRKTRVPIDSRTRDINIYPNQNSYAIDLEDTLEDVNSCQMIWAHIPMPMYLINTYFNSLVLVIGATNYMITLTKGNYDHNTLLTELQTQLNTNGAGATFTVTYTASTDNYTFSCNVPFTFNFLGYANPLNQLLGFKLQNYSSNGNILIAPYRVNLDFNNYIIMDVDQFDSLKSSDKDLNRSFALIPNQYNQLNICDYFKYKKNFNPPLGKLMRIHFRFYDRFGNPYDFQNMDHYFELIIESFKLKRKYGHVFSNI
jgi:hypothetical protein